MPVSATLSAVTQLREAPTDREGMRTLAFTWHDLPADAGVLEIDERLTPDGVELELHVVRDPGTGCSLAWWQTRRGDWLRCVEAGEG